MDPLSQAVVGAACAQTTRKEQLGWLALLGALGGLAPDLDVFIQSSTDPLLFLEYHRQFSHSLLFVPIGGLLVTLITSLWPGLPLSFGQRYAASTAGYASHGLLDACTSYGTQLLWPFSDTRISWNNISVIDPLLTLPALLLLALATWQDQRWLTWLAIGWALGYLSFGLAQQHRATVLAESLATQRQHQPERLLVKPAFGNLLLWKSVYWHAGHYYVDGLRAGTAVHHCGGDRVPALQLPRDFPDMASGSQQRRDVERFRWFSMDYLAPWRVGDQHLIIDVRYANLPNRIEPLWGIGIETDAESGQHVQWWSNRSLTPEQRRIYSALLSGHVCEALPPDAAAHQRTANREQP